jgi:hypothetical protein
VSGVNNHLKFRPVCTVPQIMNLVLPKFPQKVGKNNEIVSLQFILCVCVLARVFTNHQDNSRTIKQFNREICCANNCRPKTYIDNILLTFGWIWMRNLQKVHA